MPTTPDKYADGEEFDSWLTGKASQPAGVEPGAPEEGNTSSSWWTPSVPALPTDPAQLGSMLWGAALRVKETVSESIDGNLHELQAEQQRLLAESRRLLPVTDAASNDAPPPWKVLSEQYQILEADLRSQMLELSKSQSTFLEGPACSRAAAGAAGSSAGSAAACSPPAAVRNSALDYKQMLPTCMAALREDEQLRQRRFELVPARLDEATFWRNYFEKVFAIKDAILATSVHLNSIHHDGGDGRHDRHGGPFGTGPVQEGGGEVRLRSKGEHSGSRKGDSREASGQGSEQPALPLPESDGRAAEMAERIRRELELGSDDLGVGGGIPGSESAPGLQLPVPPQTAAASVAADAPVEAAAAVDRPVAVAAPAQPQPNAAHVGQEDLNAPQRPVAVSTTPSVQPAASAAGLSADVHEEGGEEDDGVELDSDDDIDKLLDLDDDEGASAEDGDES